jgi:hypothetical protein
MSREIVRRFFEIKANKSKAKITGKVDKFHVSSFRDKKILYRQIKV